MRRLSLLFIPLLLLLAACAQPRYLWQHEAGFGEAELHQAQMVCSRYAEEQPPLSYSRGYPYPYAGYPFYYGGHRHNHLHRHHYDAFSYSGYYPDRYAYQQQLSRACLKGKGWERIRVDAG